MKALVYAAHGCSVVGLGPYGNEWIATPHLDQLAADGIVFDHHYAVTTDPRLTRQHWWQYVPWQRKVLIRACRPEHDALSSNLADAWEIQEARPLTEDVSPADALLRVLPHLLESLKAEADWLIWIECDRLVPPWDAPREVFEAYVEDLFEDTHPDDDPLLPWIDPPEGPFSDADPAAWELVQRSYAAAMTAFDADFGRLRHLLREHAPDATLAFTSDRGYPLGEHGWLGSSGAPLHEELIHLPLLICRPHLQDAGSRVADFTIPADVVALVRNETVPPRDRILTVHGNETSVRTRDFTLCQVLQDDEIHERLYRKPEDRWEVNNVAREFPELCEELRQLLPQAREDA
jgi:hypothetical protein